ncbi:hypothetical protein FDG2_1575 [Candidatus Protofrankia californiensis]|uniref:Uncharacterized protein n=1 Tax=Candidatus Protofrankia californiensis TaxID=1839754 RepID=A0A1C3NVX4_9ACTN|nr:hypothetical protein FDG2_1575 [Candidatus Protofrankia californiensis]
MKKPGSTSTREEKELIAINKGLRTRRLTFAVSILTMFGVGVAVMASPAAASSSKIIEHYNGKLLPWDKRTWNGAKACAVTSPTDVYCFDSIAEAKTFTDQQKSTTNTVSPATAEGYDCSGWNYLISYGYALMFRDWGYWQNLSQWVTTPWVVTEWDNLSDSCKGYFRYGGGGCTYIAPYGHTYPNAIWSDQIYLQRPDYGPAPGC